MRAVVFDLDGTLMDSLPLVLRALGHAIEPFGPPPTMEIFSRLGGPPERFLPEFVGGDHNVTVAMSRLRHYHRENYHLIRPFAGAEHLLSGLRSRGIATALWTGRDRGTLDELLDRHHLRDRFDTVVSGDDLPSHKPDPAGLAEILRRLGVSGDEALMVGDADVDVLGAAACGVGSVLIRHGRDVEPEISAQAWRVVTSPFEAYELVLERADAAGSE